MPDAKQLYAEVVQWGLRRLYHELAWSYDLVAAAVSGGYWPHWITAVLPYLRPGLTLEVGCGTGFLQRALALRGLPHLGLDRSPEMLRLARQKVLASAAELHLVRGDARMLPIPSASCANIVATFPAPYILDPRTLEEIKRVLAPGGQLLIVDFGRLLGDDAYAATVDRIYRATLQAHQPEPHPARLQLAGFETRWHDVGVGQSQVSIICAVPGSAQSS